MEDGDECPLGVCFVGRSSCSLDFFMICMVMIMSRSLLSESAASLEAQRRSAGSLGSSVMPRIHVRARFAPIASPSAGRPPNLSATDHLAAADNLLVHERLL
jgi:hypothetical protein